MIDHLQFTSWPGAFEFAPDLGLNEQPNKGWPQINGRAGPSFLQGASSGWPTNMVLALLFFAGKPGEKS